MSTAIHNAQFLTCLLMIAVCMVIVIRERPRKNRRLRQRFARLRSWYREMVQPTERTLLCDLNQRQRDPWRDLRQ